MLLTKTEIENIEHIISNSIPKIKKIDFPEDIDIKIKDSILVNQYEDIILYEAYQLTEFPNIFIGIFHITYKGVSYRNRANKNDIQLIGFKKLDVNYNRLLIRPEFFQDKMAEFFKTTEFDFDKHKKFSDNYYFIGNDRMKSGLFATENRLNLIETQKEIYIETINDLMVCKYNRTINEENYTELLNFLIQV